MVDKNEWLWITYWIKVNKGNWVYKIHKLNQLAIPKHITHTTVLRMNNDKTMIKTSGFQSSLLYILSSRMTYKLGGDTNICSKYPIFVQTY